MEYQKRRKRGDHIHYINRDNSKIKRQKVFDENQNKIISENIRITVKFIIIRTRNKPDVENFRFFQKKICSE